MQRQVSWEGRISEDGAATAGRGRGRLIVAIVFALVAAALAGLWSQRKPIATGFVDRALAARGVPARYRIARLGVYDQRLEAVSLGDPRAPDLTAEWVELRLAMGVDGPYPVRVRASGVRLRGRLVDGRVTLGAIDKLLPAPMGAPFALPDLDVALSDARVRLETPYGPLGLALDGAGKLSDGFRGSLAVASRRLAVGGCATENARAFVRIAIVGRKPALDGPVRVDRVVCGAVAARGAQAAVDVALSAALDRWDGGAVVEVASVAAGVRRAEAIRGRIGFAGDATATGGTVALGAARALTELGDAAGVRVDGRYRVAAMTQFAGQIGAERVAVDPARLRAVEVSLAGGAGTPFGPLGRALGQAVAAAGRGMTVAADMSLSSRGSIGAVQLTQLDASAPGGARVRLERGMVGYAWPSGASRIDGAVAFGGGGLPEGRLSLRQTKPDAPIAGELVMSPYAAGGARLALAPVRFARAPGETRFTTVVTLDGPLGDGRVEGLTLPVSGRLGARGPLVVNEACAPLGFVRLAVAGLVAGPARLALCPAGRALLVSGGGGMTGGGTIVAPRIAGRLGSAPVTIAARRLGFAIGRPGFVADALAVRLGDAPSVSRLDIERLAGAFDARGIAGEFAGLGGKIGAVPLILSDGAGPWRLAGGVLDLGGRLRVADEADPARFNPLVANDVALKLAGGRIAATGTLREPATATPVATVAIRHDLGAGTGDATLDVGGLTFTEALQPERLTRLTLGVVANVRGTVKGSGMIRWTPQGTTSTGTFVTDKLDLAAAFGPVKGLAGTLTFADLLGLVSAAGQVATLAEVNPGIAVTGGVIRYRLLPEQRIAIEDGRWPFSGGLLVLEPTTLDFAATAERRMTFRVEGMDAAKFVEQFDFKNVAVTGTFDGTLPIIFDATGGRITGGRLEVRRGGGTLAYVGEVSNENLGMFGSLAFDALKRMRYDRLAIELDGSLDGELISRVLFDGTNETPKEAVRKNGLLSQFSNLPFRFNITIRAPFRGLLNAAQSLNDPRGLLEQARQPPVSLPGSTPVQTPVQPPIQPK